jgi:multiple sugar transport system substrate-binding protein
VAVTAAGTVLRGVTWDHPRGLGGLRATAAAYPAGRPGVTVTWTARSLQAFADQPVEELARRFDLVYLDHPAVGQAVARSCLVPLDQHLDPATLAVHKAGGVGRSAESYVWEGHRWALATDAAAQVAAYRPDLLRRAGLSVPRTWPEVLAAADGLRRAGLWAALPAIPVDAICAFLAVCAALGETPFFTGQVVSRRIGRSALALLRAMLERCHPASLDWNPPRLLEQMSGGDEVAFCPLAFGYANYARPGFREHRVLAAPPPAGGDGVPRGTLGGAGLAVSAHSPAVAEAVRYAAFVADPEVQRTVYFAGGGQPGHRSAWTDEAVNAAAAGFFRATLAAVDAALLRPRHDGYLAFQERAGELVHGHLRAGGDPDRVLAALDAAWQASQAEPAERR